MAVTKGHTSARIQFHEVFVSNPAWFSGGTTWVMHVIKCPVSLVHKTERRRGDESGEGKYAYLLRTASMKYLKSAIYINKIIKYNCLNIRK